MLIGSASNGLNSSGGFCARWRIMVDRQRINETAFVFSAAVPALLAVSASEGINIIQNKPSFLSTVQENAACSRAVLDSIDSFTIPSHGLSDHPHSPAIPLRRR